MKSLAIWILILAAAVTAARVLLGAPEAARLAWARAFAPCAVALAAAAIFVGLHARRSGRASPTVAWLAKRGALVALGLAVAWVLTPLPWPAWSFYLACAGFAGAAGVYVANLPARL